MIKLKQSGVALITVMLILALATVTAVSMASRQNLDIHRSANILNFEQAFQYNSLLESYADYVLKDYFIVNSNRTISSATIDIFNSRTSSGFTENGVYMQGEASDLQGRFNLNSLVDGAGMVLRQRTRLVNLITFVNTPPVPGFNMAVFIDSLIDWLDPDSNPTRPNGTEDGEKLVANQHMTDISEILLINGMNYEFYEKFNKLFCVLEPTTPLNINTASEEVLMSLDRRMTIAVAQTLHAAARNTQTIGSTVTGFANKAAFINDPSISRLRVDQAGLAVSSIFFNLNTTVEFERVTMRFDSKIQRVRNNFNVVKRSRSVL